MWYKNPEAIDLDKPIAAKNKGKMYLLLPQVAKDNYAIVGYNWFCTIDGVYGSCSCFRTVEEALKAWEIYEPYNVEIRLSRL